jgi:hypothetical protein
MKFHAEFDHCHTFKMRFRKLTSIMTSQGKY